MSKPTETLTAAERDMLACLLTELLDLQSSAGCNDHELENTPGNVAMMRAVLSHSDYADDDPWEEPKPRAKSFYAPCGDTGLTAYLRRKLCGGDGETT